MPFNYILTNLLVDVPEAVGAIFLDHEGETIECVTREGDPYELKVEGAYHSIFKRRINQAFEATEAGIVRSYTISAAHLTSLTELLSDGYYVVLVLRRNGLPTKAGFYLRRAARVIERELA
jgi:hypothetical protein